MSAGVPRSSSAGSWTGSDLSPVQSPTLPLALPHTVTDILTPSLQRAPLKQSDSTEEQDGQFAFFTVGDGEEDGDIAESDDLRGLSKRDIHTLNEQRRRDIIKQGYAQLTDMVPTCKPSPTGAKLSRAAMLQKTIDYIIYLQNQAGRQQEELEQLQREVKALRIMKENYEQIARAHQSAPSHDAPQVPDHVKFLVFQGISDQLFQTFNSSISVTSFDTLSSCIISWLEEYCKPQTLRELVVGNLQRVNALSSPPLTVPHQHTPQRPRERTLH